MKRVRNAPFRITAIFLLAGCAWILFSDMLVARLVHEPEAITRLSVIKGWLFMVFTATYLYWLVYRYMSALCDSEQELLQRNSELMSIEENLRCSHQQFVSLVNTIEGIVWECDVPSLRFTFVSKKGEQILGFPERRWLEESDFWWEHSHHQDRECVRETLLAAVRERKDHWLEHRLVAADGTVLWVRNNITVVADGEKVTLRGVMYDITPQKMVEQELNRLNTELETRVIERTAQLEEANQELQAIFRALPDVVFRIDVEGVVLGHTADSKIGSGSGSEFVGKKMQEILPQHASEQFEEAVQFLRASNVLTSFEFVKPEAEGERYYEARLLPFGESQMISFIRDITERKRAEEEIRMLNDDLQRRACQLQVMNQELESFSYSVSHDLRTPLRHIDGFSKALQEDCSHSLCDEGKMYVQRVRVAAQRMGQLIDDMLKLANVTSSDLVRQHVDLSSVARGIAAELQQTQPGRKVAFSIQDGIEGYADPRLLRVVLANLVGNAWKYTGKRSDAEIRFGVTDMGAEKTYYVSDNGAGFDMNYAAKLFNPFQRLHGVEEFEGSGIGLATVQRVIRRHGGRVWGEGAVGEGATFYFTLGEEGEAGGSWENC